MLGELERVFNPRSVAVVGASKTPLKIGNTIVWNLANNFKGKVYPVNPKAEGEIYGCKIYPRVTEIPGEVDLACLAVPREVVVEVMEECGEKGVKGAVVMVAGFSDAGGRVCA